MQPLMHDPAVPGIGSQVVANGARGLATGTATTAEITALMPAGAEEVSMQAAMAFATEAMEALGINSLAQEEMSRAGAAYVQASGTYDAVDGAGASVLM